jgi:16S rRNA A1518/A1519 N6-dimethyltransferase RsmA/KsgA/DIM1 with predicted DNA glycosylase/AP lyase activity
MQTQTQIRQMLEGAGLAPNKAFGQNFLVDLNLMGKVLELAEVGPQDVVLEVGPGTGSLTEELARRARRVVAVEIDRGLAELLGQQLAACDNVRVLHTDVLAGKHEISPAVVAEIAPRASLVSNLPYNVATPLVAECLLMSHRAVNEWHGHLAHASQGRPAPAGSSSSSSSSVPEGREEETHGQDAHATHGRDGHATKECRFDRLTFTVQREVGDRLSAGTGEDAYGPLSVVVAVLAKVTPGPVLPASAFWPRPAVSSRILRIDFDEPAALRLGDSAILTSLLALAFGQRRKQIGSLLHRKDCPFDAAALAEAFARAGVEKTLRPEQVSPGQYVEVANALGQKRVLSSEF